MSVSLSSSAPAGFVLCPVCGGDGWLEVDGFSRGCVRCDRSGQVPAVRVAPFAPAVARFRRVWAPRVRSFLLAGAAWSGLLVAGLALLVLVGVLSGDLVLGAESFSSDGAGCSEVWLETPHVLGSGSPSLSFCGPSVAFAVAR